MGSRQFFVFAALVSFMSLTSLAYADVVSNVSLAAPAHPIALSAVEQNVVSVHNPTSQSLVFNVPAMDFRLPVPAGESRRIMIDPEVVRSTQVLSYSVEGVALAAPLTSTSTMISTRGIYQPLVTNSVTNWQAPATAFVAARPVASHRVTSHRNLANVKSICGESRLVTIEEPCPYDPPVNVFFLGEVPAPPAPKKPVRGYW